MLVRESGEVGNAHARLQMARRTEASLRDAKKFLEKGGPCPDYSGKYRMHGVAAIGVLLMNSLLLVSSSSRAGFASAREALQSPFHLCLLAIAAAALLCICRSVMHLRQEEEDHMERVQRLSEASQLLKLLGTKMPVLERKARDEKAERDKAKKRERGKRKISRSPLVPDSVETPPHSMQMHVAVEEECVAEWTPVLSSKATRSQLIVTDPLPTPTPPRAASSASAHRESEKLRMLTPEEQDFLRSLTPAADAADAADAGAEDASPHAEVAAPHAEVAAPHAQVAAPHAETSSALGRAEDAPPDTTATATATATATTQEADPATSALERARQRLGPLPDGSILCRAKESVSVGPSAPNPDSGSGFLAAVPGAQRAASAIRAIGYVGNQSAAIELAQVRASLLIERKRVLELEGELLSERRARAQVEGHLEMAQRDLQFAEIKLRLERNFGHRRGERATGECSLSGSRSPSFRSNVLGQDSATSPSTLGGSPRLPSSPGNYLLANASISDGSFKLGGHEQIEAERQALRDEAPRRNSHGSIHQVLELAGRLASSMEDEANSEMLHLLPAGILSVPGGSSCASTPRRVSSPCATPTRRLPPSSASPRLGAFSWQGARPQQEPGVRKALYLPEKETLVVAPIQTEWKRAPPPAPQSKRIVT
jgi:hypothetical protein